MAGIYGIYYIILAVAIANGAVALFLILCRRRQWLKPALKVLLLQGLAFAAFPVFHIFLKHRFLALLADLALVLTVLFFSFTFRSRSRN